jgi:hypothetical protein
MANAPTLNDRLGGELLSMKIPPFILILAMVAGCAGGWPMRRTSRGVGSSTAAAVTATEQQLAQEQSILTTPTAARQSFDCDRARDTHDNICTLARRICLLVDRDRTTPDGRARCLKARGQCQSADKQADRKCAKTPATGPVATARADNAPPTPTRRPARLTRTRARTR